MSSDDRKTDGPYVTVEYSAEEKRELYDIERSVEAVEGGASDSTFVRLAELLVDDLDGE